ncbi:putative ABC transporter permease [Bacillaceae bacterium S4-13-58]
MVHRWLDQSSSLLFFFTIYAFFGWWIENIYNFFTVGHFLKPNFWVGPFKPMYGVAPVLLIVLISPKTRKTVVLFLCALVPTIVEYISGALLVYFTDRKWWDYSHLPFQLHGHVSLLFSLAWIILSLLCLKIIHPKIVIAFHSIKPVWTKFVPFIILYFLLETFVAVQRFSNNLDYVFN